MLKKLLIIYFSLYLALSPVVNAATQTQGLGKDVETVDQAAENAVENNALLSGTILTVVSVTELIDKDVTANDTWQLKKALDEGRTEDAKALVAVIGVITEAISGNKIIQKVVRAKNPVKNLDKTGKSVGQMDVAAKKGQAPKGIIRVDKGGTSGTGKSTGKVVEQDHVTFDRKFSLNKDGTWKDSRGRKPPILTNKQKKWLLNNGWELPK